jgi:hypothetical protein
MPNGITIKQGSGGSRVEVQCEHQKGLIYVVPANASWVCTDRMRPAHAIAGFLKELTLLDIPQVQDAMQRWGLYYRELPLEAAEGVIKDNVTS